MTGTANLFGFRSGERVAIVGNDPDFGDVEERIDGHDRVFRFNNAHGFEGSTGHRLTDLVLINVGGQVEEWLDDPAFVERTSVRTAERIILPIDPEKREAIVPPLTDAERRDDPEPEQTARFRERMEAAGKRVLILPAERFIAAAADLGVAPLERNMPAPSTGYLVAHAIGSSAPSDVTIECFGFGFEGWDGHDFDAEQRWFRRMERAARLRLHRSERCSAIASS